MYGDDLVGKKIGVIYLNQITSYIFILSPSLHNEAKDHLCLTSSLLHHLSDIDVRTRFFQ